MANEASYKIGSLSDKGWISDPKSMLGYIFGCYMTTDAAQTLLYDGRLTSLAETYHRFINDPDGMANQIVSDLTKLGGYYFPQVDVRARSKQISGTHYSIIMEMTVMTSDNERIQLAKLMEMDNADLRKIVDVNNYGDLESSYI
ncbi:hypothetical protein [Flavobacterium sp.]|jgi:hypothetical protein|uniref:hypothetical protein n=1 Tax=Flavobacterium sp. TaxID=239 RepID=UPI0037BEEB75